MKKIITLLLFIVAFTLPLQASALLSLELTRGVASAIPIAVVPFANPVMPPQDISGIISNDLQNSGRFKVYGKNLTQFPNDASSVSAEYFKRLGTDNVVVGKVNAIGEDRYQITVQLLDMFRNDNQDRVVLNRTYTVEGRELRRVAHHISDLIFEKITGIRGIFSTKIAYVVVRRGENIKDARYLLEVSDQDGYNPRPLLSSPEPIMSPAWSPNGRHIAYVSFENKQAQIYLQDVASGERSLLSNSPGINGAPAWSPDGRKLALVLSKDGSPNIYLMDIDSKRMSPLTKDYNINTEPSFSPDGKNLLFTSNRSGGSNPQIYQIHLGNGAVTRLSFGGDYNARASYTRDGKGVVMIHRVNSIFYIALLDLDTGITRVLTNGAGDSASPSIAPNDSMILYDTVDRGRNVLAMVAADGRVQLRIPARGGEAQDPAWSPFIS